MTRVLQIDNGITFVDAPESNKQLCRFLPKIRTKIKKGGVSCLVSNRITKELMLTTWILSLPLLLYFFLFVVSLWLLECSDSELVASSMSFQLHLSPKV